MLADKHPAEAQQVLQALPDGKHKRQLERKMAAREFSVPPPFSW
jgi:hypothetical protein